MLEVALPLAALIGVGVIALAGRRFIDESDDRVDLVAMVDAPAVWSPATTDEVMSH